MIFSICFELICALNAIFKKNLLRFVLLTCSLFFNIFQQLTGEQKQLAKAMADVNKASAKTSSSRKRSSTTVTSSSSSSTPKRAAWKPKPIVCYNCQQTGHIAPHCTASKPSTSSAFSSSSSSSASKSAKKNG